MKVLVIPSWYPTGEDKLMGIYHKEYCEAIAKEENVEVNMLYIDRQRLSSPLKFFFMKKKEIDKENNYQVFKYRMLDYNRINPTLQLHLYTMKLEKAFRDYIKKNGKPDLLHAQVTIPAGYATCKLGKKYNIPVVVTEHASGFKEFFKGKNEKFGKYVLDNCYFTTVSKLMQKEIKKFGKDCGVIPNLVETNNFRRPRHKRKNTINLITVSAFRKGKRIEDIISALKIIIEQKKYKNIYLNIVGDGYLMERYQNVCRDLNLESYVCFHGRKTKEEIADMLSKNDIFVVGSLFETFCIPGVEALASGMPVVSTKCYGPEEYIDEQCGKLCEIDNPADMANAIMEVIEKLDTYDEKYLRSVADRFSSKNVCSQAMKIYKKVIVKNN